MLYDIHEMQHAVLAPVRLAVQALQTTLTMPWLPGEFPRPIGALSGRTLAASAEMFERLTRPYGKPSFNLPTTVINGETVAVTEEVLLSLPFCNLLHFKREKADPSDPRLLLVAPISGHYATLLRGTVEALLPDHDVYITDWANARNVPLSAGAFDMASNVEHIIACLQRLGPGTSIMAVCQPSVPVLAAVSVMCQNNDPARPAGMILMGGPIDTRRNPTKVNQLAADHSIEWFEKNLICTVPMHFAGRGRKVYPGFLQLSGFISMNFERHTDAHLNHFKNLIKGDGDSAAQHRAFYDEYLSVLDLTAEFYLETVAEVFQKHSLPNGTMKVRDQLVTPSAITDVGLFTIEGELDDITGAGQTVAAHDLCTGLPAELHKHHLQAKVGHYGIFNGRRWRNDILPHVRAYVREQQKRVGA